MFLLFVSYLDKDVWWIWMRFFFDLCYKNKDIRLSFGMRLYFKLRVGCLSLSVKCILWIVRGVYVVISILKIFCRGWKDLGVVYFFLKYSWYVVLRVWGNVFKLIFWVDFIYKFNIILINWKFFWFFLVKIEIIFWVGVLLFVIVRFILILCMREFF